MGLPFVQGLALGAGLIIAIGAQNAFVLAQGLRRQHHVLVAAICAFSDALLILAGVAGVGALIASRGWLTQLAAWGGAAFLFWYGLAALRRVFQTAALHEAATSVRSKRAVVMATLAVTLLNPHVYLDTVVMLGSIGSQFQDEQRTAFAAGAMSASFLWFFGLALGAAWLAPYVARPITWKIVDTLTCFVMWLVAFELVRTALR
ncbi:MAG: LysE/ArgO family amino acid transporter [Pseudomonadota bacterium]